MKSVDLFLASSVICVKIAGKKGNIARKRKKVCTFKGSSKPKKKIVNSDVVTDFEAEIGHSSCGGEQQQQQQTPDHVVCTRQKKLNVSFEVGEVDASDDYNIVINYKVLKCLFTKVACPNCNAKNVNISDKLDDRMG